MADFQPNKNPIVLIQPTFLLFEKLETTHRKSEVTSQLVFLESWHNVLIWSKIVSRVSIIP